MSAYSIIRGARRRALAFTVAAVSGVLFLPGAAGARGIFITGHDSDYHAFLGPSPIGPQHIIQAAIQLTTDNRPSPRILLVTDTIDPGGGSGDDSDPRNGLIASGYPTFTVADDGAAGGSVLDVHTVNFANYDVVFVASDEGGWLRQSELDALNARRPAITSYVNNGGGLVVMPESGLRANGVGTTHDRLGFLPVLVGSTVNDQEEIGFTLTPFGASLGLTTADINGAGNFAHTYLNSAGPYTVVDNDPLGHIVSVAGKGPFFCTGGTLGLTPASQTVIVGSSGTVSGTLTDSCGNVVPGAPVVYKVTSGPDTGATATPVTDANGNTSFSDRCNAAGTDTITATTTALGGVTSNSVTVTCKAPVTMTGRAYGLRATVASLLGLVVVKINPTPDTGAISTPVASTTSTPCVLTITGLITASTLCANVTTSLGPASSTATASVQKLGLLGLPDVPSISATAITATSTTACTGSTGRSTFAALTIGSQSFVNYTPAPNTTINVGLAKVVLNEQVAVPGGLTVNALHVTVPLLGTDIVAASATSDIHNC